MAKALLLVDIQKDFCEGGSLAVAGGNEVARKVADYVYANTQNYQYVIASKDWHTDDVGEHFIDFPSHCKVHTEGAEFHDEIEEIPIDAVFFKGLTSAAFSAFQGLSEDHNITLDSWLSEHDIDELDICGLATDYCVQASVKDALELGYKTTILTDLIAAVAPNKQQKVLHSLRDLGARLVALDVDG